MMTNPETTPANMEALRRLAVKVGTNYAKKTDVTTLEERIDTLPDAPTKVSELENDSKFQTETEVAAAIAVAAAGQMTAVKMNSVDDIDLTADDADRHIYLVPDDEGEGDDLCKEYIVSDGALEQIGTTRVDLSGYVETEDGKGLSSNDFTDADKEKLDSITFPTIAEIDAMLEEELG